MWVRDEGGGGGGGRAVRTVSFLGCSLEKEEKRSPGPNLLPPLFFSTLSPGTMPIFYALVARRQTVLAEYTARSGNFPTVTRVLLTKIGDGDSKMSYVYDK
jgi:hypothetical protein